VWVENKADTFYFESATKPELVNFDAEKILLAEKKENKSLEEYIYQYTNGKNYVDRREAFAYAKDNKYKLEANKLFIQALSDPYFELRETALANLKATALDATTIKMVENIAKNDKRRTTRAAAIDVLGALGNADYIPLFEAGSKDSSYSIAGASLSALAEVDETRAIAILPSVKNDVKGRLRMAVGEVEMLQKTDKDFDEVTGTFDKSSPMKKLGDYRAYLKYLGKISDIENFKKGVNKIITFRNMMGGFSPELKTQINEDLEALKEKKLNQQARNNSKEFEQQINYLTEKLK
jgi:aminopeptidase N